MSEHTPGPWTVEIEEHQASHEWYAAAIWEHQDDGHIHLVARVPQSDHGWDTAVRERDEANARLIASAPDHPATRRRGERHWQAKLSSDDVLAIRRRRATGEPVKALASEFGIHHATVSRVARGIWRQEVGQ